MKPITIKVRTVSFKLWRQARIKAVERDIRMRVVINEALALWLRKGGEVMEMAELWLIAIFGILMSIEGHLDGFVWTKWGGRLASTFACMAIIFSKLSS